MFFERKIYQKFIAWKNEAQGHKALLVEGARRIGKSTIVEEFGKREYKSYILIDFARATDEVRGYFYQHLNDLDTFFMLLSVNYGVQLYDRESLIIFDEVQLFPKARESIKYLVADGRYDYIETGSLISIKENVKEIVVPSEERKIKMYPLDFEEFCGALGEGLIIPYIKTCFEKRQPLERGLHDKAMLLFKQYMLVGGMPKAVAVFLEGRKDFGKADLEKRDILNLYRDDIMKIIEADPYANVTFSGGDPMFQAAGFAELAREIHQRTNKDIWCFTGFTYESLITQEQRELLGLIDVLVDGPYIEKLHDPDLLFRGSSNQRLIDVQASLYSGEIVLWHPDIAVAV